MARRRVAFHTLLCAFIIPYTLTGQVKKNQQLSLRLEWDTLKKEVRVLAGPGLFTALHYGPLGKKPILWPVIANGGTTVTRGFPIKPAPGERIDHPHHAGVWFNHSHVNGLDFWNNSDKIDPSHKGPFGSIVHRDFSEWILSGPEVGMTEHADWKDHQNRVILNEKSTFRFQATSKARFISRKIQLFALRDSIRFEDNKEGLFAIRVARFLEHPILKPEVFLDARGNPTPVPVLNNEGVTGIYENAEGIKGEEVWGKSSNWVVLKGFDGKDSVAIAIFDHPANPGYPGYWHARGYGLFALNNLGAAFFSEGRRKLNLVIPPGENRTFQYSMGIWQGKLPSRTELEKLFTEWAKR